MIVVSDTSPITNLLQIGLIEILVKIYGKITIPSEVYAELFAIDIQKGISDKSSWTGIQKPQNQELIKSLTISLDKGESASIALANEVNADFLLIDEAKGRLKAQELDYISNVKTHLKNLSETAGFFISPKLYSHGLN